MRFEELTKNLSEKQGKKAKIRKSIQSAKSNEELDKLEVELRKLDSEIKELEESLNEEAAKRPSEEHRSNLNPLSLYMASNRNQVINNDLFGGLALRSGDRLEDKITVPKEERALDLGKYIKGIVTGDWTNAEAEKRAMMTTATGTVIPQVLSARIIDQARSVSVFTDSGVPVLPMTSNNLTLARVKNDPVFKFKEEGAEAAESSFELEPVTLKAKTCYGYAYVSLEAINSSSNLTQIITNTFASAIANSIDKAMLYGQDNAQGNAKETFAPSGILNDQNINTIASANNEPAYHSLLKARAEVKKNNGNPTNYIINADTEMYLDIYTDSVGAYQGRPVTLGGMVSKVSNQMKYDAAAGSDALVFDKEALAIGIQKNINIEMFTNSDECIKKGLVGFRIYSMLDCVVTQPKHITKITGINKPKAQA